MHICGDNRWCFVSQSRSFPRPPLNTKVKSSWQLLHGASIVKQAWKIEFRGDSRCSLARFICRSKTGHRGGQSPGDRHGGDSEEKDKSQTQATKGENKGPALLPTSLLFYSAVTLLSFGLGRKYNVLGQLVELTTFETTVMLGALKYLVVLVAMLIISTLLTDILPSFRKMKTILREFLIPELRLIPLWGLALVAFAAGIGEECLFRAYLQTWLIETSLKTFDLSSKPLANFVGIVVCSLLFGAAHSITLSYFVFASVAGALFGLEYLECGLPAVAFTHGMYDFIAFVALTRLWGGVGGDNLRSGSGSGSGSDIDSSPR